jgi:hypothetical protein
MLFAAVSFVRRSSARYVASGKRVCGQCYLDMSMNLAERFAADFTSNPIINRIRATGLSTWYVAHNTSLFSALPLYAGEGPQRCAALSSLAASAMI